MISSGAALAIIGLSSIVFMLVGIVHAKRTSTSVLDFISANNTIGTTIGTTTLLATVMGTWILFSPAETATFGGLISILGYSIGSAAPMIAFIWIGTRLRKLMPDGASITQYVWHRYGQAMYWFTILVMVFYMFVFLAAELTAIALVANLIAGVPLAATAIILGIATVAYTAYGGFRSTIFTDSIQFLFIVPILLITLIIAITKLGGLDRIIDQLNQNAPDLLSPTYQLGWETGIALIIAILAANLFHQGYWQRAYACRNEATLRKAFTLSAILAIPIVFIGGVFGLMAVAIDGVPSPPSTALFAVVLGSLPTWSIVLLLILAVALVMSSVDSLLNGLVSSFTTDMHRARKDLSIARLMWWARIATVGIATVAVVIAMQGYSVLYLFLIADLVASAVVIPVFLGLYIKRYTGSMAVTSALISLIAGAIFFPTPAFEGWLNIPKAGSLMVSFMVAFFGSGIVSALLLSLPLNKNNPFNKSGQQYDFSQLKKLVKPIGD